MDFEVGDVSRGRHHSAGPGGSGSGVEVYS